MTTPDALDLRGEVCPYTFLKATLSLEALAPGARLRVLVDNETAATDVPRSLAGAGHRVHAVESVGPGTWVIEVEKAGQPSATSTSSPSSRTG